MYPEPQSILQFVLASVVAMFLLVGCGGQSREQSAPAQEVRLEPNALTPAEIDTGWRLLFDGETLAGWRKYGGEPAGAAWSVKDGAIMLTPAELDDWQTVDGGDIVHEGVFEDFELSLEWKISEGGNSGIMYLVDPTNAYEYPWETGLEMQVLDNEGNPEGQVATHRAGELYDLIGAPDGLTKPVGEWNHIRIVKNGPEVEHWLNGTLALSVTLWTDEWDDLVAGSKFSTMEGFGRSKAGRISLQDHGDWVAFRNIKIREI